MRGHPIADGQTETPLVKNECGWVINHQRRAACSPHETVWLGYLGWIFMSLGALTPFRRHCANCGLATWALPRLPARSVTEARRRHVVRPTASVCVSEFPSARSGKLVPPDARVQIAALFGRALGGRRATGVRRRSGR